MASNSQRRALEAHRRRLTERGPGCFEVRGLEADKELIWSLARRLAANDDYADTLRTELTRRVDEAEKPRVGGILAALRRSRLWERISIFRVRRRRALIGGHHRQPMHDRNRR